MTFYLRENLEKVTWIREYARRPLDDFCYVNDEIVPDVFFASAC